MEPTKRTVFQRLLLMTAMGIKRIREPYYHGFAAQVAFFYLLSIVPIILLLAQMLGMIFKDTIAEYTDWIVQALGGALGEQVRDMATFHSAGAVNIIYVVLALWAASRGQFALTRIINYTLTAGETTGRGFVVERIRSLGTMFLMLVSIVGAVGVMVYGGALMKKLFPAVTAWLYLRWPVSLILFILVISFIYWVVPIERPRYRDVLPGSVLAAVGLVAVTWFYTLYLTSVASYDILYGALANIVALMFWFYFLAWVLILGVLFNKLLIDTRGGIRDRNA